VHLLFNCVGMKTLNKMVVLLAWCFIACNDESAKTVTVESTPAIPVINYAVGTAYPHDTNSFTEGLLIHDGKVYESTGSPDDLPDTRSLLGVLNLATGKIDIKAELDREKYFGEGIAFLHGKLYQLTYKSQTGFIYDAQTFKRVGQFSFPSAEGWGMTTDGHSLIMSDGTHVITYLDPVSFKVMRQLPVTENNNPVMKVNELEYIKGFIYANVYTTDRIIKIDPGTGHVVGKLDLGSLVAEAKARNPDALELNGIAYDSVADKVYITGKMWPYLYEIKFTH
jgi:glutamine cyclotransferase